MCIRDSCRTDDTYRSYFEVSDESRITGAKARKYYYGDIRRGQCREMCIRDRVHPSCKSYQSGIGCGSVVTEASRRIAETRGGGTTASVTVLNILISSSIP